MRDAPREPADAPLSHQTTLARSSRWLHGGRLDGGGGAALRLHPAGPGRGVRFVRGDLAGEPLVHPRAQHLRAQHRWSALEEAGVWVHHTEHLLGALGGLGVDNALIELRSAWVPLLPSGSCAELCAALRESGVVPLPAPRVPLLLTRPLVLEEELPPPPGVDGPAARCSVLALPDERLSLTCTFHVPALPGLRVGVGEHHQGERDFAATLGAARSFDLRDGLGRGAAAAQGLLVMDERTTQAEVDEIARHKALDLLGDLMVLGQAPRARFVALRSGHRLHARLVRTLAAGGYLVPAGEARGSEAGQAPVSARR